MLILFSCKTNIEVFAPEKEIYSITGVLNPTRSEQFIKVSTVFQFEGDIYQYGTNQDFSVKGLLVTLEGDGKTWIAEEREDLAREEGLFAAWQTLYVFSTSDSNSLQPFSEYTIHIRMPGNENIDIEAKTTIPGEPGIVSPRGHIAITNGLFINPTVSLNDGFTVTFDRPGGYGFELRVYADYYEGDSMKTVRWGPTNMFREPVNCYETNPERVCYSIPPSSVLITILSSTENSTDSISFDDGPPYAENIWQLNNNLRLESTSMDSCLMKYIHGNDPFGFGNNLLMDKKDFSNIEGGIGIFGSIHSFTTYLRMDDCDEFLAGLNYFSNPPAGCEW